MTRYATELTTNGSGDISGNLWSTARGSFGGLYDVEVIPSGQTTPIDRFTAGLPDGSGSITLAQMRVLGQAATPAAALLFADLQAGVVSNSAALAAFNLNTATVLTTFASGTASALGLFGANGAAAIATHNTNSAAAISAFNGNGTAALATFYAASSVAIANFAASATGMGKGTTAARPTGLTTVYAYYDTTLNRFIYYVPGTGWRDAYGNDPDAAPPPPDTGVI